MRLLLIEDDPMIGDSIAEGLRAEHYALDWVRDGQAALLALVGDVYDLLLLDLGLPGRDGLEVLRQYRARGGAAPVLIITARDSTLERVQGLDAGADDYLVKPFDLEELSARVRALLRRGAGRTQPDIVHRALRLRVATHEAFLDGQPLPLSAREFSLLAALLDPPGRVMSKALLEQKLYGWNEEVESNTVDVYVHRLRKKLGADFIKNVRGVGYLVPLDAPAP
jgi:two-component system OmpR family response regulator/two-component system response regulator QseB